jgi:O-antigen/teichoic acid export membrane protein
MGELKAVWDVPRRAAEALRSPLYTNAVYLMLSQATMAGLGFVFWVIVARYYSEAELGYSSAIISTISLVALVGHMGLDSFLVRFLSGSENPRRLLNTCLTYSAVATTIAALIAAAGFRLWAPGIGFVARQPLFLAAFVAFAIVTALFSMAGFGFIGGRQAKYLLLKDAIFSATKLFLPLLFVQHFHAFGVVASWGLATTAGLLASLAIFMPRMFPGYHPRPTWTARLVRRAWGFSGMSYLIILISTAPRFIMPLVVINLLGPEENAYFYVAWAIATLLFSIPGSLAQSLFAEGSHDKRKVARDVKRSVLMSVVLLLPAILFVWLLGSKMLLAFGGSYSERSIELLRILALAAIPITVERAYFAVLRIRGRLRKLTL